MCRGTSNVDELLMNLDNLVEVDLSGSHVSAIGLRKLIEALKTNDTVTDVYLDENDISDKGIMMLVSALEINHGVTTLSLSQNDITNNGVVYLARLLTRNSTLRTLDLRYNDISDYGVMLLADSIMENPMLDWLCLNQITTRGANLLADLIEKRQNPLKRLDLESKYTDSTALARLQSAARRAGTEINFTRPRGGLAGAS